VVKAAYESQKDTYMQPEQAEVEQALFSDKDAAQKVADAVKSGKDLKDSVLQITGKDSAFQGKNSFAKDGLPSAISGPVFAGKSGDLIGPVLSPLGYHVIKLIGLKAPQAIAFDKVKDKIRKELEDEKSGDALYSKTTEIEDRLANGEQFEDIKDAYHLTLIPLKNIDKNSKLSKELSFAGKSADQVMAKILSVSEGPASELKDIGDNKLFSVHLDKLVSAAPQPFANVKADVQRRWTADNQSQENMLNAQKLVDDLNAGKTNVSAMEDAMKVKLQNIPALTRTEKNSPLASDVAERFMRADKGQFIMAISKEKNGVYIGRVQTITLPEQPSAKTENSRAQIESDLASSNYMNYLGTLQNKYSVTINDKLLERTYGQSPSDSK
jgi:peptidyl-prolyl cis-trans isomerase D